MNEDLLAMIRANVREPVQVVGDVYALMACNEIGSRRLVAMMREFNLRDLDMLGEAIITRSRRGMTEAIAANCHRAPGARRCASTVTKRRSIWWAALTIGRRPDRRGLHRHVRHVVLRDQLSAVLYGGIYHVRHQLRGGAAYSEQHGHAGCGARHRTGRHASSARRIRPRCMLAR